MVIIILFSDVQDLREMFEPFGTVMEADVISGKNYGFVHIDASIGKAKISQIVRLVSPDKKFQNFKLRSSGAVET
jgi:hypothetical protein